MLDKKQIQAIFLFEFKMGHKVAKTTCNINNTFGPGTAKEHTAQWWFKKLCKGDESLENEGRSGRPEVNNDPLSVSSKLIMRSCQRTQWGHLAFEANWKVKKLLSGSQVALTVKNPPANAGYIRCGFDSWVRNIPWRRAWQSTLVFLPGESHGQSSLVGYSSWGCRVRHDWSDIATHACTHLGSYLEI